MQPVQKGQLGSRVQLDKFNHSLIFTVITELIMALIIKTMGSFNHIHNQ